MAMKVGVSLISLLLLSASYAAEAEVFDVTKYGAKANAEISQALLSAWKGACESTSPSSVVVPAGTYKLNEIVLKGPCKAPLEVKIEGTLQANADPASFKSATWVDFRYITGFTLSGGGTFDGQGARAWARNDCHKNKKCARNAMNLSFNFITNGLIHDVTTLNSKNFHVNVLGCKNVTFQHFTVTAPGESPNTDGIHLGRSTGVNIIESTIKTGDDCISLGDGMRDMLIEKVTCGPGHGISIGSLGKFETEEPVSGITVRNCSLSNTQNGIRIKTWPSVPGRTTVSDFHVEDIIMDNVGYPIVIDQEYCPHNLCKLESPSKIKISNISYKNIRGTSSTKDVVKLNCSKGVPCENIEIGDIDLAYNGREGPASSTCANVHPKFSGKQNPPKIC
uniref:Putative polygalacturonase-like n=1 Tax=Davidia involucrata TaxID=16924 RepID=A0A5B6Z8C6_DAVIN